VALFALETGMRRGEVCGLQWRDIDLATRTVTVSHQLVQYEDYTTERKEPKTEDGARTVSLSSDMVELVSRRREQAMAVAIENGWRRDFATSYVFPYKPKVVSSWFHRVCKKLGLNSSFHSLRHTSVTRLLDAGADIKYVTERVGHSDSAFTRDRYQLTNAAGHDKVADLAGQLFQRKVARSKVVPFKK
jgi:ATP-dependent helicase/nuclease subunit A